MEAMISVAVGITLAAGIYLLLRARTFPVLLGLTLISYAANLLLFASGGLTMGASPIITYGETRYPDPMPQALVLTAIVIGFAMTAFLVVLALRSQHELKNDHVDGQEVAP